MLVVEVGVLAVVLVVVAGRELVVVELVVVGVVGFVEPENEVCLEAEPDEVVP